MTHPQVRPDPAFGLLKLYDVRCRTSTATCWPAAVERVWAAGGRADEPARRPFGLLAECVDDQGATFRLWQPAD